MILGGVFVTSLAAILFYGRLRAFEYTYIWPNWLDPVLTIGTIFIAVFIWYNEKKQDWENSLTKKLNVQVFFDDSVFYEVENAPLTGADDIRQWGQQLGRQMNGEENLTFREFHVGIPVRGVDESGNDVMRYHLKIWLQTLGANKTSKKWTYGEDGRFLLEAPVSASLAPTPEIRTSQPSNAPSAAEGSHGMQ